MKWKVSINVTKDNKGIYDGISFTNILGDNVGWKRNSKGAIANIKSKQNVKLNDVLKVEVINTNDNVLRKTRGK